MSPKPQPDQPAPPQPEPQNPPPAPPVQEDEPDRGVFDPVDNYEENGDNVRSETDTKAAEAK